MVINNNYAKIVKVSEFYHLGCIKFSNSIFSISTKYYIFAVMKKIFILLISLIATTTIASGEDYKFPPELETLIANFSETREPVLPEPEGLDRLKDDLSVVPGKMPLRNDIIVNKRKMRLYVVNVFGDTVAQFPVCASRNRGQKQGKDDCRTPEGTFSIIGIYNSTDWKYKGTGAKCYGPYFISLKTPGFWGIGIHGTNAPGSIPGRSSHGCIRLNNDNIVKLKGMVNKDSRVTILPDDPDAERRLSAEINASSAPAKR